MFRVEERDFHFIPPFYTFKLGRVVAIGPACFVDDESVVVGIFELSAAIVFITLTTCKTQFRGVSLKIYQLTHSDQANNSILSDDV